MASSSSIAYCTDRDLLDVFPSISGFDLKTRIYNWSGPSNNIYTAYGTGLVTVLFADGDNLGVENDPIGTANGNWNYNEDDDEITYYNSASSPNDMIIEAGDDWGTIKTRFKKTASRLIDGRLDSRMSKEVLKDREGNYPTYIVRATAIQTIVLLLKAHDPENPVIDSFISELDEIIDGLKGGTIVLPGNRSMDSSKGIIREVTVNAASDLRPVELRGNYSGSGYELLKVYIDTGEDGVIGTSKMTVKGKNTSLLKTDTLIDSDIITGDFQSLGAGSLYIRWGGDDVVSAITTVADEYEIELWGSLLDATISTVGSIRMSRR